MRTQPVLVLLLLVGCGRTPLSPDAADAGAVLRPPVVACPQGGATYRELATAARPLISSLVVDGNDLYVASHVVPLPMLYRLRGSVERFSRCGGGLEVLSADDDRPESLVASAGWIHWLSADHDFGGTNTRWHVKSLERAGSRSNDRTFEGSPFLSALGLSRGAVHWLETTGGTVTLRASEEQGEVLRAVTNWPTPEGRWSLLPADGDALVLLRRDNRGLEANRFEPATGQVLPLWSTSNRPDLIAPAADAVFYVTWDAGRMQRAINRHALGDLAGPTTVLYLGTRVPTAMVHDNGVLFFADENTLTRLTLATGESRSWPLELSNSGDERVTGLVFADSRLYLARSWSFGGQGTRGSVWVMDLP